ncbi:hypothetical protein JW805_02205 [Roseomonas aeriglobus]|nr:hypothetical protein [Roseomonas aeriglobus]
MSRPFVTIIAAIGCIAAPAAEACLCAIGQTQADIDAQGARAFGAADLIVDATVGDVSWWHRTACGSPRLFGFGQAISADRAITVHRILKGRTGFAPTLIGRETRVERSGCVVLDNSCDITIRSHRRTILFLHRVAGGRYRALSGCDEQAIRNSRVGQALFKRAG